MAAVVIDKARWYEDGDGFWVAFRAQDRRAAIELVSGIDKPHDLQVKVHGKRRSLDANAYLWVLLDALAAKLGTKDAPVSKVDVYRQLIPNVGGVSEVVCVPEAGVEKLRKYWEEHGIGWVTDTMPSKIEGCTVVILYYGSSTYDTAQMSRLIDLAIVECKEQGIETMTPAELARLEGYGE